VKAAVKRQRFRLVDKQYQFGLAWRMLGAFLLLFSFGIILVFAPSVFRLLTGDTLTELEHASQEFLILHHRIWPAVLFVLVGIFLYTLWFSRRIAGPIYRINSVLQTMLKGEYPNLVPLRKGDHFHSTAELLEALSRKLAGKQEKQGEGKPVLPDPSGETK
jgi:nitrate reductase NapE component